MGETRIVRLRYTLPALDDLDSILDYISAQSPQGAQRVQSRIQIVIDLLSTHPNIGTLTDDPTIRRMTVSPFPYLIFYGVAEQEVVIHAVRHAARDPSGMPGSA